MKKPIAYALLISSTVTLLSACASVQTKIADLQLQKRQLANGRTVYLNFNVTPTADWNCQSIGTPQFYNWAMLQTKAQLHPLGNARTLLMQNAIDYANQQNLNTNFISLQLPTEKTVTTQHRNWTSSQNLDPYGQAVAVYYQCQKINPNHQIGFERKQDVSG